MLLLSAYFESLPDNSRAAEMTSGVNFAMKSVQLRTFCALARSTEFRTAAWQRSSTRATRARNDDACSRNEAN